MNNVEKLLATARAEVGYLEKASNKDLDDKIANSGSANYTKYARDLDALGCYNGKKQGFAWCDVFVDWCFVKSFGDALAHKMTFQPEGGYGAGCGSSAGYYRVNGRFFTSNPQPGDQIFFYGVTGSKVDASKWAHTGLVERVDGSKVYTIEGNTSAASGVIANGGGVARKSYALNYNRIAGYGRPDWSLVGGDFTSDALNKDKSIEMEDDDMDQGRFNEMFNIAMNEYRKTLQDNDCGAWSEADRQWAIDCGLIYGGDPLPDGTPNYMWADSVTREQVAALFHRFARIMGKA